VKAILIGDCHSTASSKDEVEKLLLWAYDYAKKYECEDIIMVGDLFDTHQHVNLDVTYSYLKIFGQCKDVKWVMIPGNHDHSVHGSRLEHALVPFKVLPNVLILDAPHNLVQNYKGIDFAPFCRTEEEFLQLCQGKQSELLICHQEFKGAEYENGFFAPHGTDLDKVPYTKILSGHIHKPSQVGPCYYVGAPRWLKTSDANQPRFIYLLDGHQLIKQFDTRVVCRPIYKFDIMEGSELPVIEPNARYIIEARGTATFLDKINTKYSGKAEVRGVLEYQKDISIKESVGINKALENFVLNEYKLQYVQDKEWFWDKLKEELREY